MGDPYLDYLRSPDRLSHSLFIQAYLGPMTRLARRVVSCQDLADDVVQESLLRLGRQKDEAAPRIRDPRAYVFRTVINVGRNLLKQEKVRARHESEAARRRTGSGSDPPAEIERREAAREVYRAIDRLPVEYRVAAHLALVEGLTYRQISEVTGASVKTVSSRVSRGRALLRKSLGSTVVGLGCAWLGELRAGSGLFRGYGVSVVPRPPRWLRGASAAAVGLAVVLSISSHEKKWARSLEHLPGTAFVSPPEFFDPPAGPSRENGGLTPAEEGGNDMERSLKRPASLALALGLLGPAAGSAKAAEPGDLITYIPSPVPAPDAITYDSDEDGYWVASGLEYKIYRLSRDLKQEIDSIPLPFQNPIVPQAGGIAYHPGRRTLFVGDTFHRQIHEIERDGTLTGRVIDMPALGAAWPHRPGGIAFDPTGDGGQGSLYVAVGEDPWVIEMTLEGGVVRTFPRREDVERVLGRVARMGIGYADPIYEGGKLTGFYATAATIDANQGIGMGLGGILKLGADGAPTGVSISLLHLIGCCGHLMRRPFPHPETGEDVDAFVGVGSVGRFGVLAAGEPAFHEILAFQCAQTGRRVDLSWNIVQTYDAIEILRGCEVLATLPGDAVRWEAELTLDGLYNLSVRGAKGFNSSRAGPCELVVGPGQTLASAPHGAENDLAALSSNGKDLLVVNGERKLFFFDLNLKPIRAAEVSQFFLGPDDEISSVAFAPEWETVYVYNGTRHLIGKIDFAGNALDFFEAKLPNLEKDPTRPARLGSVAGLVFDHSGQAGSGSFWVLERVRNFLYELDQGGNVVRELPHPYHALTIPFPGFHASEIGFTSWGLAPSGEAGARQVLVSGTLDDVPYFTRHIFRMDLATGKIVPGSEVPNPLYRSFTGAAEVRQGERARLFTVGGGNLFEIQVEPSAVQPPTLLLCRQPTLEDAVELTFRNNGPYDAIEVFRDCERLATIDGAATGHVDRQAPVGLREYTVRGVRGGQASDQTRCRLQVGPGAFLGWARPEPVITPFQVTFDPVRKGLYVAGRDRRELRKIFRFSADLKFIDERPISLPEPWSLKTLAVRVDPAGDSLLYMILGEPVRVSGEKFLLAAETLDGVFVEQWDLVSPVQRSGHVEPVGLSWDPDTDTFWYLETQTDTFVQVDPRGRTLRTLRHPLPSESVRITNHGFVYVPERSSFLTTILASQDQAPVPGCFQPCPVVSRVVEVDLQGRLTGLEIPLRREMLDVQGIAVVGREMVVLSTRWPGAILRLKALPESDGGLFIRGDVNLDGRVDISDPVALLGHLFLGGARPGCLDAADGDDSGLLDLTDGIYVLNFLFLGRTAPPPPFPGRGTDLTADGLDCARAP